MRLLLQLRIALALAALLLLLPSERLTTGLAAAILIYTLVTAAVAWRWERYAPHLQRHPLLITSDIAVASSILISAGPTSPFFMATVLTSVVAGVLFGRRGVVLVAAFQLMGYTGALLGPAGLTAGFQELVIHPLLYFVAGFAGLRLRAIFAELAAEQAGRRSAELAAASAGERARLARDMHDSVAGTLRGTALAAQALPLWLDKDPERALATARQISHAADTAAREARQLLDGLRDDSPARFPEAVRAVAVEWGDISNIALVTQISTGEIELRGIARHEALSILREALANVERHAAAVTVHVALSIDDGHAALEIQDDGQGFDPAHTPDGHYGLRGMRERASHAGAELNVASQPGQGTTVTLKVPLMSKETPA